MTLLDQRLLLLLAVAATIGARTSAQDVVQKHLLRNAYEVGKTTWYRQTMATEQLGKLGDRPTKATLDTEVVFRCDTKEVVAGTANLRRTFTRVRAKSNGPVEVDFDSATPGSRPGPYEALAAMVGQWVELRTDDRGRIADIVTSPYYPEKATDVFDGDLKQWLEQGVPPLPDGPVAIGENWTEESQEPMLGVREMKSKITTTLVAVEGNQAKLHRAIEVNTDGVKFPTGMTVIVDKCEGDITLDLATGMLITSTMTMTAQVAITGVVTMNTTIVRRMGVERIDPPPAAAASKGRDAKTKNGKDGKDAGGK